MTVSKSTSERMVVIKKDGISAYHIKMPYEGIVNKDEYSYNSRLKV